MLWLEERGRDEEERNQGETINVTTNYIKVVVMFRTIQILESRKYS